MNSQLNSLLTNKIGLFVCLVATNILLWHASSSVVANEPSNPVGDVFRLTETSDSTQQFRLDDGSIVSVDYDSGFVSVQLGFAGPKLNERFIEDDFGGIFWEWGQLAPSDDGTWAYRDWFDTGYQSLALPLYFLY